MSKKQDPLAGVRVSAPAKTSDDLKPKAAAPKADAKDVKVTDKAEPTPKPEKPPEEPKLPKAAPSKVWPVYVVKTMARRSWQGLICVLKVGKAISRKTHSAEFITMLQDSGVELELQD